jgi:hypothetical protein
LALTGTIEYDIWLINSGASSHMTGDRKNFSSMKENETPHKVELGDKNSYAVKGIRKVTIKMELGNSIHLSNILYVPGDPIRYRWPPISSNWLKTIFWQFTIFSSFSVPKLSGPF